MEQAGAEDAALDERWHVRKDGSRFWGAGMMFPMKDGEHSGYLKILSDRSGERNAGERQKLLLAELQHRVRNIIAVVRSLAGRTMETSATLEDFAASFDGRLATLARTQNVLTRSEDVSLDLGELIWDELNSVGAVDGEKVLVEGPVVKLRQKAAEAVALAIHELATNASKHGALARSEGKLSIVWRTLNTKAGPQLVLEWRERGVPLDGGPPKRSGFGRELIEKGLPYELEASTSLEFGPDGLSATVQFPYEDRFVAFERGPDGEISIER